MNTVVSRFRLPETTWTNLRNWRPEISTEALILLTSTFFALACNTLFWRSAMATSPGDALFAISLFALLMSAHALLLGLLVWRWNAKVLLTTLFFTTAFAVHYMDSYNVYLDADMLRNVLATDRKESSELMTSALILPLLGYGVLPTLLLWRSRIRKRSRGRALLWRVLLLLGVVAVGGAGAMASFQNVSALMRNHREVRYLATPVNYLVALKQNLASSSPIRKQPKLPIGTDAKATPRAPTSKPRLLVLVVGETVRAQNWGLNGYARQTTPELAQTGAINFPDMHACGTSTEVSLPCMFSPFGRHNYDEDSIRSHQSLLHVLENAGISTLWRDNQSGCKGVCDGLPIERLGDATQPGLCADGRCMDEILINDLATQVRAKPGDRVVVLHQLGNHGPSYYERYPEQFRQFAPTCDTPDLGKCDREQIVNSYDNAIRYTDHFLSRTIAALRGMEDYDTAMIYLSDHGESLGEKGLYLHGMPYAIAPEEQTRVPMLMWFSPGFATDRGLDLQCLRQRAGQHADHDNLFPSVLGLMQVRTSVYDRSRDLFAGCDSPGTPT
ncbi:phosphoethanolamine--lipid A transferase [Stenotrophomonas sp. SY1]|uniref:phosphoethanolamine transferase n=1 Tax=Stenotrophomonas sp. SY1 TaxID=477235 RepID=UPI001E3680A4|nr:phosphoethanolamine--lipid A transferase [Stenotrophomonas sp. SY1]MCD9087527.1 phosphoethanolamine transferase [Stenotrophomonas sp. SY1]